MGQVKLLEDRIHAIEEACADQHAHLEMYNDPTDKKWTAYIDDVEIGEPGTFVEMIEAIESELAL